jgi:hypothetical protein
MSDFLNVSRKEDMSPDGGMRLLMEPDGDICVFVVNERHQCAGVQFTTPFGGGGGSKRTYKALRALMRAMAEDNADPLAQNRAGEFGGALVLAQVDPPERGKKPSA